MVAKFVDEDNFDGCKPELVVQLREVDRHELAEIASKMIKYFWEGRPLREAMLGSKYSEDIILFSLAFFYTE